MQGHSSVSKLSSGILFLLGAVVATDPAQGQNAILDRQSADATIRIVNGTTNEPARAERVLLREPHPMMEVVAEAFGIDGEVVFRGLQLYNFRRYLATAWVNGVPYHAEQRGQDFLDGKALDVHSFASSDDLEGVVVSGMNIVVRQRVDGFGLEYILIVSNESRPQHTIAAESLPIQLTLPSGLDRLRIEVGSGGPDPRPAELKPAGDGRQGIAVALTPGSTRLTIGGILTDVTSTELIVSTNLDVRSWSLLAWPAELQIHSFDLERDRQDEYPEFRRWLGKPLQAKQQVRITIEHAPHLVDLLPDDPSDAPSPQPAASEPDDPPGFPYRTVLAAIVLIGCYLWWRSRR
jgi:hypothetical protein